MTTNEKKFSAEARRFSLPEWAKEWVHVRRRRTSRRRWRLIPMNLRADYADVMARVVTLYRPRSRS